MGPFRLAVATLGLLMMATTAGLSCDMNASIRRDPFLYAPLTLAPALWLVAAAALIINCPDSTAVTVAVVIGAILSLLLLDNVHRVWLYVNFGIPRRVTLGVTGEWTFFAQYPVALLAVVAAGTIRWRAHQAASRAED